jgi:uncharacterized sulfatase
VQNLFTTPSLLFRLAMHPLLVPLWTRHARFKGDTEASIGDVTRFIQREMNSDCERPCFLFVNLMQTHLPFTPPQRFVDRLAPVVNEEPSAVAFMQAYNKRAACWMFPLEEPLPDLQFKTMSDMYDAEVAYQDHLLAQLLEALEQPLHRDRTMVIIVSDHGEMLGEHQLMGHGLGVYQELAHVPLMIRLPATGISFTRVANLLMVLVGVLFILVRYEVVRLPFLPSGPNEYRVEPPSPDGVAEEGAFE